MSQQQSTFVKRLNIMTYVYAGLAVASCIVRNDFNVVFSFLILMVLNKFFKDGDQFYTKIIFQLFVALLALDLIWLAITLPYWNSTSKHHNDYWESLAFVHGFAIFMAFCQIGLKVFMAYFVFAYYRATYKNIKDLFSLKNEQSVPRH